MALFKKRPSLVFGGLAHEMVGGEILESELVVKAEQPVPVDWIKVSLEGHEFGAVGSGKSRTTKRFALCHLAVAVCKKRELEVGTHRFPFRIDLPANLPPTYSTGNARTTYVLRARASVPWWPDAKIKRDVLVAAPVAASPHPGEPMVLATRAEGPLGTEPYAEVSFSHKVFASGDVVRGAVAVRNAEHHRYRRIVIKWLGQQQVRIGRRTGESKTGGIEFSIDLSEAKDDEQVPFTLRLNKAMAPTFTSVLWTQTWRLKVELDVAWKFDPSVEMAVPIVETRYARLPRGRAAPAVGAERLEACWQEVADRRKLELLGSAIRGTFGGTTISVWREGTAKGPRLHGKIDYPSLGLGLELEPADGFFSGAGRHGVQLGVRSWDKAHQVSARDAEQCKTFLAGLGAPLVKLADISMSDSALTRSIAGAGNRIVDLDTFVAPLVAVAHAIEASRGDIGPPAAAAKALPAWTELAGQLDGEINAANLSIAGRFHGHPVTVEAAWSADGEPAEIVAELELAEDLETAHEFQLTPTLLPDLPGELPSQIRELVGSLAGVASRLEARGDRLVAASEWLSEPRHILGVLRTLSEIAAVLQPRGGPFR